MKSISSILVVVDRNSGAADAVAKAVHLAQQAQARVELYLCDVDRAYALSRAYERTGIEDAKREVIQDAHRYLDALRPAMAPVPITIDAECESPLYESIVRKVERERPDMVIKCAGSHTGRANRFGLDATDWQLMRACPGVLMLTRGRPWSPFPHFAAAIDVSGAESAGLAREILQVAHVLTDFAGGELDMIFAESPELSDAEREAAERSLDELIHLPGGPGSPRAACGVNVLSGTPEVSLPKFAGRRCYDALFLGALTHRPGLTAQVGTLTSNLVDALECDFILVKPGAYRSPFGEGVLRLEPIREAHRH